jgi:hypothetical protein
MGFFKDIIIGLPIGIVYAIFMNKLADVLFEDLPYREKFQRAMITLFVSGILGIVLAQTIFSNSVLKNRSIKV